jgi:Mrp family chromosome partitioning ATPase/capsular polysaccharide biosynthesis protein
MNETTDATSIFAPLWRRKWLILAVGIIVGAGSYFYYKRQRPTYAGSTQIYLGASAEEQAPGEKTSAKTAGAAGADQASIINSIVVEEVRQRLHVEHKAKLAKGVKIRAKAPEKSEFINISVEGAHSQSATALLANLTAQTYIKRARANHRRVLEGAISLDRRQLRRLEAASAPVPTPTTGTSKGKKATAGTQSTVSILRAATLSTKINELESNLAVVGAQQVKPAKAAGAELLSPEPRKDAIFGFVLGIVLAAIAAYILSRFDRRLRSLAGIEAAFQSHILAALPKVARPIVQREGAPTPSRLLVEPLRRLHTALQLGEKLELDSQSSRRVILFISPDAGDGKSTMVSDMALIQRDAGERVAVVEANFRRPVQSRLLGLDRVHGLADVLAGTVPLEEALQRVTPGHPPSTAEALEPDQGAVATVTAPAGSLFLLAGGEAVPNPPALLGHEAMPMLLGSLARDFDYVLIDAPSPLEFSDALPLLSLASGIVIVARVGHTREIAAQRLLELLARSSAAPVLGVAANCVAPKDSERYGFSAPGGRAWPGQRIGQ